MKSISARIGRHRRVAHLVSVIAVVAVNGCAATTPEWPQWGGPNRDFVVETGSLADSWPADGPKKLWKRELGDGYSAIVVDHGALYTMYVADGAECTAALDAETGQTIWEHRNPAPYKGTEFGPGPHATPLIVGDRLFAVGANAAMHAFDKKTGEVLWHHDLAGEFGATIPYFGYAPSPIAYHGLVIVPVDRPREGQFRGSSPGPLPEIDPAKTVKDQALMAFDQKTGRPVWKGQDYAIDYSSPILINFDGEDQLVLFMRKEVIGVDPSDGDLLWHIECLPSPDENIATPIWNGKDLLFFSAAYNSGGRTIRLTKKNGKTVPEQLWYNRKLRIMHGNAVRVGDYVYGSSGDFGAALLTCMNLRTGEVAWRERGFKKATFVYGDDKLIILDEDGDLALASVTPAGLTVHSRCKVAEHLAWTAPTLAGTTLYVRDRKNIVALDLG